MKAVASPISSLMLQPLPEVQAPLNSAIPVSVRRGRERGRKGEDERTHIHNDHGVLIKRLCKQSWPAS